MLRAARRENPELFLVGVQNQVTNRPLYQRLHMDRLLVPTETVAHEVRSRIGTPLMWQFVLEIMARPNSWSQEVLDLLAGVNKNRRPRFWRVDVRPELYPSLGDWLSSGDARLGQLLRDPQQPDQPLDARVLLIIRNDKNIVIPTAETPLQAGDELLLAGTPGARVALNDLLTVPAAFNYEVEGRQSRLDRVLRTLSGRS